MVEQGLEANREEAEEADNGGTIDTTGMLSFLDDSLLTRDLLLEGQKGHEAPKTSDKA